MDRTRFLLTYEREEHKEEGGRDGWGGLKWGKGEGQGQGKRGEIEEGRLEKERVNGGGG